LRITPKEQGPKLTLALEGKLAGPWVAELAQAWSEAQTTTAAKDTTIDLRLVWFIDEPGQALLTELHAEGCDLVGSGCFVGPIVQNILKGGQAGTAPLRWCWLAALGLAAAGTLAATETPAPPAALALSLNQAIHTALAQNPNIHKSLLAIAQSQEDRRMTASAFMPTINASASMSRVKQNLDALLGSPEPGYLSVGPFDFGGAGVDFAMPLFDLSLWNRWKASQHGEAGARAQAHATREAITALVVGQYLRAQRASESVKAADSRVRVAEALAKLAEDQLKNGVATKLDHLRAQVQLQNERQRLIQAQTQLKNADFGLIKLLDLNPATRIELTDSLNAPTLPVFSFEEAYRQGLAQRPERAALDAREQAAESLRSAAQDLRLPTLVAMGNYTSMGLYPNQPWVPTYNLTVGIKVPLFTGGRISAQTAKAKLELDTVKEERKELDAQVGLEVQVAQAEMEASRSEVDVTTQGQALAEEELIQARHRFEAGVSNNIELINAQDELARATDNRINSLYRLNQSRADLARAMGQLEPLFAR
jgi:outer membrane protein TolC